MLLEITTFGAIVVFALMAFALSGKPRFIGLWILAGFTLIIIILTPFGFALLVLGQIDVVHPYHPFLAFLPLAILALIWLLIWLIVRSEIEAPPRER